MEELDGFDLIREEEPSPWELDGIGTEKSENRRQKLKRVFTF